MKTLSTGEYLGGKNFNPSGDDTVSQIKQKAAELIDLIEDIPANDIGERVRCKALAITNIENGAMWGVKAATKQAQE